ncbi:CstA-like transporter-associated (seleno)protein [Erwiniaceae bacterium L1_54_6]|nr:CstA-like transporter-associated (seleno)protein [Erwiniaceae bacterium L1_54_6]
MSDAIHHSRKPAGAWHIRQCLPLASMTTDAPRTGWQRLWRGLQQSFRLMVGVHDYQNYLQHMRLHHPGQTPMNERDFYRYCLNARFPSEPGKLGKCPC